MLIKIKTPKPKQQTKTMCKSFRNGKKIHEPNKLCSHLSDAGFFQTHSCSNAFCQLSEEFDVITKELPCQCQKYVCSRAADQLSSMGHCKHKPPASLFIP